MLFVNPNRRKCGVYQFGEQAFEAIQGLGFTYTEDLANLPRGEIYLFNWHPGTNLGAVDARYLSALGGVSLAILHDPYHDPPFFDAKLRADPTFPDGPPYYGLPRIIKSVPLSDTVSQRVTVGSWGYGLQHKHYDRVVRLVEDQLDGALIRLHIPFSDWCDPDGSAATYLGDSCRRLARRNEVEVSHGYMDFTSFVRWAHQNTVNVFTCSESIVAGISSCIDFALMAKRPIGVSQSMMYKHVHDQTTCLARNSISALIERGQEHLEPYRARWSPAAFCEKVAMAVAAAKCQS